MGDPLSVTIELFKGAPLYASQFRSNVPLYVPLYQRPPYSRPPYSMEFRRGGKLMGDDLC